VAPAALLTSVVAHIRMTDEALRQNPGSAERRRLLANRARVAILAGRLAFDDLGNAMAARAHYSVALDAAREARDDNLIAAAHGYAAQLSAAEGCAAAALGHLTAARDGRLHPLVKSWLSAIEAAARADTGDHAAALDAIDDANAALTRAAAASALPWFDDHDAARLVAATGHALLRAGHYDEARGLLRDALSRLPAAARRQRVLCLVDQAAAGLEGGDLDETDRLAADAADLLRRTPYSVGRARLRALRSWAAHSGRIS
jgi:tetratricopeptide (TPR) repeat protein